MTEAPSERTRVKRLNKRAKYDAETVHGILDASPVCHVGYMFKGTPYVTPTLQWREDDRIYWHGSSASRMLETCVDADVCVTVTMIDGMVMARPLSITVATIVGNGHGQGPHHQGSRRKKNSG